MYMLDIYSGTLLLRVLYTNRHLYFSCLCRLIMLILFNFRSVVRIASGKINFTGLLCREVDLF